MYCRHCGNDVPQELTLVGLCRECLDIQEDVDVECFVSVDDLTTYCVGDFSDWVCYPYTEFDDRKLSQVTEYI